MNETKTYTYVTPYLFMGGRAEEAIEFYKGALGAQVHAMMQFSDSPEPMPEGMLPPGFENKVMHCEISIAGTKILISDGCSAGSEFKGFSLAITLESPEAVRTAFAALSQNATVTMPLGETFWAELYGMVTDQFGIDWMVMSGIRS